MVDTEIFVTTAIAATVVLILSLLLFTCCSKSLNDTSLNDRTDGDSEVDNSSLTTVRPDGLLKLPPSTIPADEIEIQMYKRKLSLSEEIQILQNTLRGNGNQLDAVRQVQKLWLEKSIPDSSDESTRCKLIIGVDATPHIQAGYCINLEEKSLQFYVVKREHLPWILRDLNDPCEFEMKNLIFALTVWNEDIIKYKRIRVYTDNFAVKWENDFDKYGSRAADLLRHYERCEAVTIMNKNNIALNKYKNLKYFAKFIQPADDLSRWAINDGREFLADLYGIEDEDIHGTHVQTNGQRQKPWFEHTALYWQLLKKVNDAIRTPLCNNPKCAGILQKSKSLQNISNDDTFNQSLQWKA